MLFDKLYEKIKKILIERSIKKEDLNEQLEDINPAELTEEELKNMLITPEIRPCTFDLTLEAWIYRISNWGKLTITYINQEFKEKRIVTPTKFIEMATDDQLNKVLGLFGVEGISATKCKLYREYLGLNNKKYKEEFIFEIELDPKKWKPK